MPQLQSTPQKGGGRRKKLRPFFDFKANKFTKLARDYHHELKHITADLSGVNRRVQESAVLCQQQLEYIKKKLGHLVSPDRPVCFGDTLYHLENLALRVTGYRDKLVQFINQALRLGNDEKSSGMLGTLVSHGTVRDAHLDTELKRFNRDNDFNEVLSERILMTHRRYYKEETGYSPMLMPVEQAKSPDDKLKLWRQNIQAKVNRANRIVLKVIQMNNKVMNKINLYLKKHPFHS
jgi:hypothetical protein